MPAPVVRLEECASTNAWVLERLGTLDPGIAVWTPRQTAGRGREGRSWFQPEGSLAVTVVAAVPAERAGWMALAAGLAVIHACEDLAPGARDRLRLKWPNDVRTVHGKLAGILCEGSTAAPGRLAIGIGCNLRAAVEDIPGADSLHRNDPAAPGPEALIPVLQGYLAEAAALIATRGLEPLLPQIRRRDALLGVPLSVRRRDGLVVGHGAGIDESGRLLVMTHGGVVAVDAGHIEPG